MRRFLIVAGGHLDVSFLREYLKRESFDKVVAADAGLKGLHSLGIVPDVIVGDFDSADPALISFYRKIPHIIWDVHNPIKDDTDTALSVNRALAMGAQEIVILGATGGRIDHLLGNIHLLYSCLKKGVPAYIVDEANRIRLIDGQTRFFKEKQWGRYISFIPLTETVRGLTLTGFYYGLEKKDVEIGPSLLISNEIVLSEAIASFDEGVLIVVESKDCPGLD